MTIYLEAKGGKERKEASLHCRKNLKFSPLAKETKTCFTLKRYKFSVLDYFNNKCTYKYKLSDAGHRFIELRYNKKSMLHSI